MGEQSDTAADSHVAGGDIRHARSEDLALLPEIERAADALFADRDIGPLPPVTVEPEELARARILAQESVRNARP